MRKESVTSCRSPSGRAVKSCRSPSVSSFATALSVRVQKRPIPSCAGVRWCRAQTIWRVERIRKMSFSKIKVNPFGKRTCQPSVILIDVFVWTRSTLSAGWRMPAAVPLSFASGHATGVIAIMLPTCTSTLSGPWPHSGSLIDPLLLCLHHENPRVLRWDKY